MLCTKPAIFTLVIGVVFVLTTTVVTDALEAEHQHAERIVWSLNLTANPKAPMNSGGAVASPIVINNHMAFLMYMSDDQGPTAAGIRLDTGKVAWTHQLNIAAINLSPSVHGYFVAFTDVVSNSIHVLHSETGKLAWKQFFYSTNYSINTAPTVTPDALYVGLMNGYPATQAPAPASYIAAFDIKSGDSLWNSTNTTGFNQYVGNPSVIVVSDKHNIVYSYGKDGRELYNYVNALNLTTGKLIWKHKVLTDYDGQLTTIMDAKLVGDALYILSNKASTSYYETGEGLAVNAKNGSRLWAYDLNFGAYGPFYTSFISVDDDRKDGGFFFESNDASDCPSSGPNAGGYCLTSHMWYVYPNGTQNRIGHSLPTNVSSFYAYAPMPVGQGFNNGVVVAGSGDHIRAYSVVKGNGTEKWSLPFAGGVGFGPFVPATAGGHPAVLGVVSWTGSSALLVALRV